MENQINYYRIDRAEWRNFYKDHIVPLTNEELDRIKSLNDRISMEDVSEVYMPMVHLLQMFMKTHHRLIAGYPDMDNNDEFVDDIE